MRQYQYVSFSEDESEHLGVVLNNWAKNGWRVFSITPILLPGIGGMLRYYVLFEKEV